MLYFDSCTLQLSALSIVISQRTRGYLGISYPTRSIAYLALSWGASSRRSNCAIRLPQVAECQKTSALLCEVLELSVQGLCPLATYILMKEPIVRLELYPCSRQQVQSRSRNKLFALHEALTQHSWVGVP